MKSKQSCRHYSEEFKWQVVQEVLLGKLSKEAIRLKYGIRSNSAILYWMRVYSGNSQYKDDHTFGAHTPVMSKAKELETLEEKVKQLEEALRKANLRADLWQKMIEVASNQLQIDIKKKYGVQQSKRTENN
jgi:transposase